LPRLPVEAARLARLRMHDQKPRREPENEDAGDGECDRRVLREGLASHDPPSVGEAMSAAIVNPRTCRLPTFERVELTSSTFLRSGSPRRPATRRSRLWYQGVRPRIVNFGGAVPPVSEVSRTSLGRTSETSPKTRSHETRLASAVVSALICARCSAGTCCR